MDQIQSSVSNNIRDPRPTRAVIALSAAVIILAAAAAYLLWTRPVVSPMNSVGENTITKSATLPDGRLNITSPNNGDTVGMKFSLQGYAQGWFEGNVPVKVLDAFDNVLYNTPLTVADNYGTPAPFSVEIALTKSPAAEAGRIVITDYSAKDGSVIYQKVVNIRFSADILVARETAVPATIEQSGEVKIYANSFYGFKFSFPKDWTVIAQDQHPTGSQTVAISLISPDKKMEFGINVESKRPDEVDFMGDYQKEVTIDGQKVTAYLSAGPYEVTSAEAYDLNKDYSNFSIPIQKGNTWFVLQGLGGVSKELSEIHSQIISSFRFAN